MKRFLIVTLAVILTFTLILTPVNAFMVYVPDFKLLASDGAAGDAFGYSVAMSGDTAVVGAYYDDDNGSNSGAAYVYSWNGTTWEETKLLASDGAAYDQFGISVAVSGDTVIVGAFADNNRGAAYVYRWDGTDWNETKLVASDGAAGDRFGLSVALNGDTAVVGAYTDDDKGSDSGSAYVYRWDGTVWVETKLVASDGAEGDGFGYSVAVSGDTAVVGARYADDNGSDSGSAYVYSWNGTAWKEAKLLAGDGAANDWFGISVAVSGNTTVIGASCHDDKVTNSGSAYVYRWDGTVWVETKLVASDGAAGDQFGYSVAVSGDTAIVGAVYDDDNGSNSGSAYVYDWDGNDWNETKLVASDGASADFFGHSVAVSGDTIIVGARYDDDNGSSSGSAYIGKVPISESFIDSLYDQIADLNSQIESMYTQEEYDANYGLGYDTGHDEGYDEGYDTGHDEGYTEGYDTGHDEGYTKGYDTGNDEGYAEGYEQGLADAPFPDDTLPPAGSIHAYDNYIFPPNKKMVDVTVSGYVRDDMSMIRDGGGTGVSDAYLQINGGDPIPLTLEPDGSFIKVVSLQALKGAVYEIELYAADTTPVERGGPNSGLVDETYVRVR